MSDLVVVLLVEDEALLHMILEESLRDAGFEIVIAADGNKAVAELNQDAGRFHAVVTDIRLGDGPSGWDVARHARERAAEIPVVYMSADSAIEWTSKGVPKSIMIQKPFVMAQVVTAVATLLNSEHPKED